MTLCWSGARPHQRRSVRAFVDTSALVALYAANDKHHRDARRIAKGAVLHCVFVSTTAVMTEFHSHILYRRGMADARRVVSALLSDPVHNWASVSRELIEAAIQNWIDRYSDQTFSLTDAVSFEVMRREKITHAFAFDRHFETAGFQLLQ
jgi:predicted nucleic acid-binding protein